MSFITDFLGLFTAPKEQRLSMLTSRGLSMATDAYVAYLKKTNPDAQTADDVYKTIGMTSSKLGEILSRVMQPGGQTIGSAEETLSAAPASRRRVEKFFENLRRAKSFSSMPTNPEEAIKWIKANVPMGDAINNKSVTVKQENAQAIRNLAQIMNDSLGTKINTSNPDIGAVARDLAVAFSVMTHEQFGDFVNFYYFMNMLVDKITVLVKLCELLGEDISKTPDEHKFKRDELLALLKSVTQTLEGKLQAVRSYLQSDEVVTQIGKVANSPTTGVQALMNVRDMSAEVRRDAAGVSRELMNDLLRVNGTFHIAVLLRTLWQKLSADGRDLIKKVLELPLDKIREAANQLMAQSPQLVIKLDKDHVVPVQQVIQEILNWRVSGNDVGQLKAVEQQLFDGSVLGSAEIDLLQDMNVRQASQKLTRKELVKAAIYGINQYMKQITTLLAEVSRKTQNGEIPVNMNMKALYYAMRALEGLNTVNVFYSVIGIYTGPNFVASRIRFLESLDYVSEVCTKLASSNPIFGQISKAVNDFQKYLDSYSDKYEATHKMTIMGRAEIDEKDLDFIPQLRSVMTGFDRVYREFGYAMMFQSGLQRMRRAGEEVTKATTTIHQTRVEAVGESVKALTEERERELKAIDDEKDGNIFRVDMTTAPLAAAVGAQGANSELHTAVRNMVGSMYDVKIKMLQTGEAIDTVMEKFIRAASVDPKSFADIYMQLKAAPSIADWYNNESGNALVNWFEAFPVALTQQSLPSYNQFQFTGTQHYYDLLQANSQVTFAVSTLAANRYIDNDGQIVMGNPMIPQFATKYEEHYRKALAAVQGTGALKNLLSTFYHIAKKVGGDEMISFMSPTTVYRNLCEYIARSSLTRQQGWYANNQGVLSLSHWLNHDGNGVDQYMVTHIVDMAGLAFASAAVDTTFTNAGGGVVNGIGAAVRSLAGPAAPAAANTPLTDANMATILGTHDSARRHFQLMKYGFTGTFVGSLNYTDATHAASTRAANEFWNETDRIMIDIIHSIYTKLVTSIELYTSLYRPLSSDRYYTMRSIIGGADYPNVMGDYVPVYYGLVLLAEFYRRIFGFVSPTADSFYSTNVSTIGSPNVTEFIGVVTDGMNKFGDFLRLMFIEYRNVPDSQYTDSQVRQIVDTLNRVIGGYSSDVEMRTAQIMDDFIQEVNSRYGLVMAADAEKYRVELDRYSNRMGQDITLKDNAPGDALSILPGEDDMFTFDTPAPSATTVPYASRLQLTEVERRKKEVADRYRQLVTTFITHADNLINQSRPSKDGQVDHTIEMMQSAKHRINTLTDASKKYDEIFRLLSSGTTIGNIPSLMMRQELQGATDLLRLLSGQLIYMVEFARTFSSWDGIIDALKVHLQNCNEASLYEALLGRYDKQANKNGSFLSRFISYRGATDKQSFMMGLACVADLNDSAGAIANYPCLGTEPVFGGNRLFGVGNYNAAVNNIVGLSNNVADMLALINSNAAYAKRLVKRFIMTFFDFDMIFADFVNLLTVMSHNLNKGSDTLMEVQIDNGRIYINYDGVKNIVTRMFAHVTLLRKGLHEKEEYGGIEGLDGDTDMSISMLNSLFYNFLFVERTNANHEYSLSHVNDNLTALLKFMIDERTWVEFTSDKVQFASRTMVTFTNADFMSVMQLAGFGGIIPATSPYVARGNQLLGDLQNAAVPNAFPNGTLAQTAINSGVAILMQHYCENGGIGGITNVATLVKVAANLGYITNVAMSNAHQTDLQYNLFSYAAAAGAAGDRGASPLAVTATSAVDFLKVVNNTASYSAGLTIPLPIMYGEADTTNHKPLVDLDFVMRTLVYFNSRLPNGGLPYKLKEMRTSLPIYEAVAPTNKEGKPMMFWRSEMGFPDMYKDGDGNESYANHSLMIEFNRILFSILNTTYDPIEQKIYKAILDPLQNLVGGNARSLNSYPDLYPNTNGISAFVAEAKNMRQIIVSVASGPAYPVTVSGGGTTNAFAVTAFGLEAKAAAIASDLFLTPYAAVRPTSNVDFFNNGKSTTESGLPISLEQMILATELLEGSTNVTTALGANFDILPGAAPAQRGYGAAPAGGVAASPDIYTDDTLIGYQHYYNIIMNFFAPLNNQYITRDVQGNRHDEVVKRTFTAIDKLFPMVTPKVSYRPPFTADILRWGIRKDPMPSYPVFASVHYLISQFANNKINDATPQIFMSIDELSAHNKNSIVASLPYQIDRLSCLAKRAEIMRKVLLTPGWTIAGSLDVGAFASIDMADLSKNRTTVWGNDFRNKCAQFINEIAIISADLADRYRQVYAGFTDDMSFMETMSGAIEKFKAANGETLLTPLHFGLLASYFGNEELKQFQFSNMDSLSTMQLMNAFKVMLTDVCGDGKIEMKNYPGFAALLDAYEATHRGISVTKESGSAILKDYVTLTRYVVGNRVFKASMSNEMRFVGFGVKLEDLKLGGFAALMNTQELNGLIVTDNVGAMVNAQTINYNAVGTMNRYGDLIQSLIIYAQSTPRRGATSKLDQFLHPVLEQYTAKMVPGVAIAPAGAANITTLQERGCLYATTNHELPCSPELSIPHFLNLLNQHYIFLPFHAIRMDPATGQLDPNGWVVSDKYARKTLMGTDKYYENNLRNKHTQSVGRLPITYVATDYIMRQHYGLTTITEPRKYCSVVFAADDNKRFDEDVLMDVLTGYSGEAAYKKYRELLDNVNIVLTKDSKISSIISYFNIVPFNANLLSREIGLGNLMVGHADFIRLMRKHLNVKRTNIDFTRLGTAYNFNEALLVFLANPYVTMDVWDYEASVASLMRGNNGFDLGRPQYLSDQVFSKALLGSLYANDRDPSSGGPQTQRGVNADDRGASAKYMVLAALCEQGLTSILSHNDALWKERYTILDDLSKNKHNIWRNHSVRKAMVVTNSNNTDNFNEMMNYLVTLHGGRAGYVAAMLAFAANQRAGAAGGSRIALGLYSDLTLEALCYLTTRIDELSTDNVAYFGTLLRAFVGASGEDELGGVVGGDKRARANINYAGSAGAAAAANSAITAANLHIVPGKHIEEIFYWRTWVYLGGIPGMPIDARWHYHGKYIDLATQEIFDTAPASKAGSLVGGCNLTTLNNWRGGVRAHTVPAGQFHPLGGAAANIDGNTIDAGYTNAAFTQIFNVFPNNGGKNACLCLGSLGNYLESMPGYWDAAAHIGDEIQTVSSIAADALQGAGTVAYGSYFDYAAAGVNAAYGRIAIELATFRSALRVMAQVLSLGLKPPGRTAGERDWVKLNSAVRQVPLSPITTNRVLEAYHGDHILPDVTNNRIEDPRHPLIKNGTITFNRYLLETCYMSQIMFLWGFYTYSNVGGVPGATARTAEHLRQLGMPYSYGGYHGQLRQFCGINITDGRVGEAFNNSLPNPANGITHNQRFMVRDLARISANDAVDIAHGNARELSNIMGIAVSVQIFGTRTTMAWYNVAHNPAGGGLDFYAIASHAPGAMAPLPVGRDVAMSGISGLGYLNNTATGTSFLPYLNLAGGQNRKVTHQIDLIADAYAGAAAGAREAAARDMSYNLMFTTYFFRTGLIYHSTSDPKNGILPITEAISLPSIRPSMVYSGQGHGPHYKQSSMGASRTGTGYDVRNFLDGLNHLAKQVGTHPMSQNANGLVIFANAVANNGKITNSGHIPENIADIMAMNPLTGISELNPVSQLALQQCANITKPAAAVQRTNALDFVHKHLPLCNIVTESAYTAQQQYHSFLGGYVKKEGLARQQAHLLTWVLEDQPQLFVDYYKYPVYSTDTVNFAAAASTADTTKIRYDALGFATLMYIDHGAAGAPGTGRHEEYAPVLQMTVDLNLYCRVIGWCYWVAQYLQTFIADVSRVDLIITNMLFSEYKNPVDDQPVYLFYTAVDQNADVSWLFTQMTQKLMMYLSNSLEVFKPFDKTYYDAHHAINTYVNYGAEQGAAILSTAHMPTLLRAFKTPAYCLPVSLYQGGAPNVTVANRTPAMVQTAVTAANHEVLNRLYRGIFNALSGGYGNNADRIQKKMVEIVESLFACEADEVNIKPLAFTYTFGEEDGIGAGKDVKTIRHARWCVTDGERLAYKKSVRCLASHLSLICILALKELPPSVGATFDDFQNQFNAVKGKLQTRLQNTYFFNSSAQEFVAKASTKPLENRRLSFPVKYGTAIYDRTKDSFNRAIALQQPDPLQPTYEHFRDPFASAIPIGEHAFSIMLKKPIFNVWDVAGGAYRYAAAAPPADYANPRGSMSYSGYKIFDEPRIGRAVADLDANNHIQAAVLTPEEIVYEFPTDISSQASYRSTLITYTVPTVSGVNVIVAPANTAQAYYPTAAGVSTVTKSMLDKMITASQAMELAGVKVGVLEQGMPLMYFDKQAAAFDTYYALYHDSTDIFSPFNPSGMSLAGIGPISDTTNWAAECTFNPVTASEAPRSQYLYEIIYSNTGMRNEPMHRIAYKNACKNGTSAAYFYGDIAGITAVSPYTMPLLGRSSVAGGGGAIAAGAGVLTQDIGSPMEDRFGVMNSVNVGQILPIYGLTVAAAANAPGAGAFAAAANDFGQYTAAANIPLNYPFLLPGGGGVFDTYAMVAPAFYRIAAAGAGAAITAAMIQGATYDDHANAGYRILMSAAINAIDLHQAAAAMTPMHTYGMGVGRPNVDAIAAIPLTDFTETGTAPTRGTTDYPLYNYSVPIGIFSPGERFAIADWNICVRPRQSDDYHKISRAVMADLFAMLNHSYHLKSVNEADSTLGIPYSGNLQFAPGVTGGASYVDASTLPANLKKSIDDQMKDLFDTVRAASTGIAIPALTYTQADYTAATQTITSNVQPDVHRQMTAKYLNGRYVLSFLQGDKIHAVREFPEDVSKVVRLFAKMRFDTKLVRDLIHIHLVYNITAHQVLDKLTDLGKEPLYGKAAFNPKIVTYTANQDYEKRNEDLRQDRDAWAKLNF